MLSVDETHFEEWFCASKRGGVKGGGWVSARSAVHMAAVLAGYRTALVGTGWTTSHLVNINGLRNHYFSLVGTPFLAFSQVECSLVGEP